MSQKFVFCPDCGTRAVKHKLRANGQDHFWCRNCDFTAFTKSPTREDLKKLKQLRDKNPGLSTNPIP